MSQVWAQAELDWPQIFTLPVVLGVTWAHRSRGLTPVTHNTELCSSWRDKWYDRSGRAVKSISAVCRSSQC